MMEVSDPRELLETFKQNDAYNQLLTFTEVKKSFSTICQRGSERRNTDAPLRVSLPKLQIFPRSWSRPLAI
jgi:hypothetical protein